METIEIAKDRLLYYQFEGLREIDHIEHLFTSRIGWNDRNTTGQIARLFNMPETSRVGLKQVHGANIVVIDSYGDDLGRISNLEGDGLITNLPNIILSTGHADCVPIYFVDPGKRIVGIAHGGWRGTYGNITGKMIGRMVDHYGSDIEDIIIGIGPSIGPCCYEVGMDLGNEFKDKFTEFPDILVDRDDRVFLDLWKVNYLQAKEKGIGGENIIVPRICTSCNMDKFHSYRGENGTDGRMIAAIGLRDG